MHCTSDDHACKKKLASHESYVKVTILPQQIWFWSWWGWGWGGGGGGVIAPFATPLTMALVGSNPVPARAHTSLLQFTSLLSLFDMQ